MAITKHVHKDPAAKKRADHMRHQHARLMRLIKFTPYDPATGRGSWNGDLLRFLLVRIPHLCDSPFVIGWVMEWYGPRQGEIMLSRARREGRERDQCARERREYLEAKKAKDIEKDAQKTMLTRTRIIDLED